MTESSMITDLLKRVDTEESIVLIFFKLESYMMWWDNPHLEHLSPQLALFLVIHKWFYLLPDQ